MNSGCRTTRYNKLFDSRFSGCLLMNEWISSLGTSRMFYIGSDTDVGFLAGDGATMVCPVAPNWFLGIDVPRLIRAAKEELARRKNVPVVTKVAPAGLLFKVPTNVSPDVVAEPGPGTSIPMLKRR